jgi:hypothetical protein
VFAKATGHNGIEHLLSGIDLWGYHHELFRGMDLASSQDRIGRRKTYIISWSIYSIGAIVIMATLNIYQYMAGNFLMGFGGMPMYILNYVIINETMGPTLRQKSSIMTLVMIYVILLDLMERGRDNHLCCLLPSP